MRLIERLLTQIDACVCRLVGHDCMREITDDAVFLRCQRCRKRTTGWQVERRAPPARPIVCIYPGMRRPSHLPVFLRPIDALLLREMSKRSMNSEH